MKILCVLLPHFLLRCELQRHPEINGATILTHTVGSQKLVLDASPEPQGLQRDMPLQQAATLYWIQIGFIMATGLTMEEARGKIYQNLIDKGDFKGAEILRQFQDKIHPQPNNKQPPPCKPPPLQSSK